MCLSFYPFPALTRAPTYRLDRSSVRSRMLFSSPLFDLNVSVITLTSLSAVEGTWADCVSRPLDLAGEMTEVEWG